MNRLNLLTLLALSSLSLEGCSKTREQFNFSKKAPDEFAVVTRAPLEMPENLDRLPAPRPGAVRPQETTPEASAKQALFGSGAQQTTDENLTEGEAILLQKTGTAETNIRDVVDAETQEAIKENTSTWNKILGKAGKKVDAPATVVDPIKENERIMQNKKAGNPITEGETPYIEQ